MLRNLPLDANDEDLIQRGLRRPSLQESVLPITETFQAVRTTYDNAAAGAVSVDNIWPARTAEELANLTEVERRQYLEQRGLVPPEGSLPADISVPGIDQLVENAAQLDQEQLNEALNQATSVTQRITNLNDRVDQALSQGANIPTDSYGQPLIGATTSPQTITTQTPSRPNTQSIEQGNNSNSPYVYTPIDLYDDRYDFKTGRIIRKGIATGAKGGIGAEDRPGSTVPSTGVSDLQAEPAPVPPSVTPNDTSAKQYDDAILRQERAQEYSSPTVNNETTARVAQQADQTVDYTDSAEADTGNWAPPGGSPPRTETSPPVQRASRQAIRESRRQTTQEIRNARQRGENLVRLRRPDGIYYAGPPKDVSDRRLPQRARDMGF